MSDGKMSMDQAEVFVIDKLLSQLLGEVDSRDDIGDPYEERGAKRVVRQDDVPMLNFARGTIYGYLRARRMDLQRDIADALAEQKVRE